MSEMPWSLWIRKGTILLPRSNFDLNLFADRYGEGTEVRAKFAKPRSKSHHDLYWAVLDVVVKATDKWAHYEDLHDAIKLHLRMVKEIQMIEGGIRFVSRSIAFDKMEQGEYNVFFRNAMRAITEATGIDTDAVIAHVKGENPGRFVE